MAKQQHKMKVCSLSDELMEEILSWLPVKSLIRFKCVSKNCHSIITSSCFRNLLYKRLTKQINSKNNALFILSQKPSMTYTSNIDAVVAGDTLFNYQFPIDIGFNYNKPGSTDYLSISESCNGLFCLRYKHTSRWSNESAHEDQFVLYNPATRAFKRLPTSPRATKETYCHESSLELFGFGYDYISDDYKVIKVVRRSYGTEMHIFSLRTNCWSTGKELPVDYTSLHMNQFPQDQTRCALANNALHWISCHYKIIGVDLHSGECRELQCPPLELDYSSLDLNLDGHGGYLNLTIERRAPSVCRFDIWRMNKYGDEKSWSLIHTIEQMPCTPRNYIKLNHIAIAIGYSNKQVEDFVSKAKTRTKTPKQSLIDIKLNDVSSFCHIMPFVPSLVPF